MLPEMGVVDEGQVECIDMQAVDIHHKDFGFVGHALEKGSLLVADQTDQGSVVVVGLECIGFGAGLVIECILNHLDYF